MDFLEQIITSVIYFEGTASGTVSNTLIVVQTFGKNVKQITAEDVVLGKNIIILQYYVLVGFFEHLLRKMYKYSTLDNACVKMAASTMVGTKRTRQ